MNLTYTDANGNVLSLVTAPIRLISLVDTGLTQPANQTFRTPGRDGETYVRTLNEPRFIRATCRISTAAWATLHTTRRTLSQRLNPKLGVGKLTYTPVTGGTVYEIPAVYEMGAGFGNLEGFSDTFTVAFRCPDPAWRVTPVNEEEFESVGSGMSVGTGVPTDFSPGTPFSVNNTGDLASPPVFVITGEVTRPLMRNATLGKVFELDVTIPAGMTATVDMDARTAVRSDGLNLMGFRTAKSEMWSLAPGVNTIELGWFAAPVTPVQFDMEYHTRLSGV